MALVRDGEAADRDAVDLLDAGRQLVLPGDVVARAGRHHFDRRVPRQALGDVARVQFRAAVDVRAVALDDDRQLHDSDECPSPPSSLRVGVAGRLVCGLARRRRTTARAACSRAIRRPRLTDRRLVPSFRALAPERRAPTAADGVVRPARVWPALGCDVGVELRPAAGGRGCCERLQRRHRAGRWPVPGRRPSSARARRSSKSSRLAIDSSRIFRFCTSMAVRVSSTTRLWISS